MKKCFRWVLPIFLIAVLATGCANQNPDDGDSNAINDVNHNPFEMDEEETVDLGSIGHGFVNPELDEIGNRLPLRYDGRELKIDYTVRATGKAKNVGFLVFVDGIPQPYKFNTTDAPYEYMHIFDLEEDDKDTPFTFIFTPVTGKKGETLDINITSVYNPAFIPNMKETSSYGGYHSTLMASGSLFFEEDAKALEASSIPGNDYISNIHLSTEPVTNDLLERHSFMQEVTLETLENQVLSELFLDGDSAMRIDNLQVSDSGTLHVTFKIFGHPGVKYRNALYINHQALSTKDGDTSFETILAKGEVAVLDVEIDLERLEEFNTFYVVSVPINLEDFPDSVISLEKSRSILLYQ